MKHRYQWAAALLIALCVVLFCGAGTARAADAVPYYYYTYSDDGETATLHTDGSCTDYTVVTADLPVGQYAGNDYVKLGANGTTTWYVVKESVTITSAPISTFGTVHLILCDGVTLTVTQGIKVNSESDGTGELNIYGQSEGTGTIYGADFNGHGVIFVNDALTLRMHGCHITGNQSCGGVYLAGYSTLYMYGGSIYNNKCTGDYYGGVTLRYNSKLYLYDGTVYGNSPADVVLYEAEITRIPEPGQGWNGGHKIKVNIFDDYSEPQGGAITQNWPEGADPADYFESGNETYRVGWRDYVRTKCPGLSAYYTISFDAGDGTGTMDSVEVPEGNYMMPECPFTPPEGKVFSKWKYNNGYSDYYCYAGKNGYIGGNYAFTAVYAVPVSYQYCTSDGAAHEGSCADYTIVTSDTSSNWWVSYDQDELWYVVQGNVTINNRIEVDASYDADEEPQHMNLILCDGATLNVPKGIYVREYENNNLTIYAQSNGADRGKLIINGVGDNQAGIGGNNSSSSYNNTGGVITIHGGDLTVKGGANAAGIGGGCYVNGENITGGAGGTVTIYGGNVTATGGDGAAGIGGGANAQSNGALTVGDGLIVQASGDDGILQVLSSPYDTRPRTMIVSSGEGDYTIFFRDNGWLAPYCLYKDANGVPNSDGSGEYMTNDGDFWRLSADKQPVSVQFFEKQPGKERQTAEQTVSAIYTAANGVQTDKDFFVMLGAGSIVTVVKYPDNTGVSFNLINSGGTLTKPADPDLTGNDAVEFVRWEREDTSFDSDGNYIPQAYDFNTPVTNSFTLYAIYQKKTHTLTFDSGISSETVTHGEAFGHTPSTPVGSATKVFQKWVLAEALHWKDTSGSQMILGAGTAFDFQNQPVQGDVKLKAQWAHRHVYQYKTLKDFLGSKYESGFDSYNEAQHVAACTGCTDSRLEAHNFVNGKCTLCQMAQPVKSFSLRIYVDGKLLMTREVKKGTAVGFYAPSLSGKVFSKWQIAAPGGSTKQDVGYSTYISFSLGSNADLYAVYNAEKPVKPILYLRPSRYDASHAKIQIDWQLPSNCGVLAAGILTATNRGLQKASYISWNDYNGKVDMKNLLKKYQDRSWYEPELKNEVRYRIVNQKGYDGGYWKGGYHYTRPVRIFNFAAQNLPRNGGYAILHQLPTGSTEAFQGPYVYPVGYLIYYEKDKTTNNVHYIYTNPVAISASYIPQYTFSVDANGNLS